MTPEDRSLLERTHELVEENNKLLKSIRRSSRIVTIMRISYWVIIVLISIGAYYFIQPYIDAISNGFLTNQANKTVQGNIELINDLLR